MLEIPHKNFIIYNNKQFNNWLGLVLRQNNPLDLTLETRNIAV